MIRSTRALAPQKVNRRTKLNVDLDDVEAQIVSLSNQLVSLSNEVLENEVDIETLSNFVYPEIQRIDTEIASLSNDFSSLSNEVRENEEDIASLSNYAYTQVASINSEYESLSNDLYTDYLTISELNDQLTANYIQKFEKLNFVTSNLSASNLAVSGGLTINGCNIEDLIPEPDPYVLPPDITLNSVTTQILNGTGFPENIFVNGTLIPHIEIYHTIGLPSNKWLEGHFKNSYADNLSVNDGGTTRRVLLEGDTDNLTVDWSQITNVPDFSIPTWASPTTQSEVSIVDFGGDLPYSRISGVPDFIQSDGGFNEYARGSARHGMGEFVCKLQTNGVFTFRLASFRVPTLNQVSVVSAKAHMATFTANNFCLGHGPLSVNTNIEFFDFTYTIVVTQPETTQSAKQGLTKVALSLELTLSSPYEPSFKVLCFTDRFEGIEADNTFQTFYIGMHPESTGGGGESVILPPWVAQSQSQVNLSAFNQDIAIASPGWVTPLQSGVSLSGFGGTLPYSRITSTPTIPTLPVWVTPNQNNVSLEGFLGMLSWSRIADRPSWAAVSQSQVNLSGFNNDLGIANVPSWVSSTQGSVLLSNFGGNIDASRVTNLPTSSGGASKWGDITEKPEWTTQFAWQNVGASIDPPETTNFDILCLNSITPAANDVYNIGQDLLRWRYLYSRTARLTQKVEFGVENDVSLGRSGSGNLVVNAKRIEGVADPISGQDVATKAYVDAKDASTRLYIDSQDLSVRNYVDIKVAEPILNSKISWTTDVNLNAKRLTNVANGINTQDAVTVGQVNTVFVTKASISGNNIQCPYNGTNQNMFGFYDEGNLFVPSTSPNRGILAYDSITPNGLLNIGQTLRPWYRGCFLQTETEYIGGLNGRPLYLSNYNSAYDPIPRWELRTSGGHFAPYTSASVDLGSTTKLVRDVYAQRVKAIDISLSDRFPSLDATLVDFIDRIYTLEQKMNWVTPNLDYLIQNQPAQPAPFSLKPLITAIETINEALGVQLPTTWPF